MQTTDVLSKLNLLGSPSPAPRSQSAVRSPAESSPAVNDLNNAQIVPSGAQADATRPNPTSSGQAADSSAAKNGQDERGTVKEAVKNVNAFFQEVQRTLEFKLSEDTGQMVVEIKDATTNEVIRQIPGKEMVELAKRLDELRGLLFEDKA